MKLSSSRRGCQHCLPCPDVAARRCSVAGARYSPAAVGSVCGQGVPVQLAAAAVSGARGMRAWRHHVLRQALPSPGAQRRAMFMPPASYSDQVVALATVQKDDRLGYTPGCAGPAQFDVKPRILIQWSIRTTYREPSHPTHRISGPGRRSPSREESDRPKRNQLGRFRDISRQSRAPTCLPMQPLGIVVFIRRRADATGPDRFAGLAALPRDPPATRDVTHRSVSVIPHAD